MHTVDTPLRNLSRRTLLSSGITGVLLAVSGCANKISSSYSPEVVTSSLLEKLRNMKLSFNGQIKNMPADLRVLEIPTGGIYKLSSRALDRITTTPIEIDETGLIRTSELTIEYDGFDILAQIALTKFDLKNGDICILRQTQDIIYIEKKTMRPST